MSTAQVNEKARHLVAPVLGSARTEEIIRHVSAIEELDHVRVLRPLLMCEGQ